MDFFIDESGNSGDLIHAGRRLDFDGQPIFTLTAVGIPDVDAGGAEVERLKQRHRVGGVELKSSALAGRPAFVLDLVALVLDADWPLFVEVVDKRYVLCATIVSVQLLPPVEGVDEGPDLMFVRNTMADWLWLHAPDATLMAFIEACRTPCDATLGTVLGALASVPIENDNHEPEVAMAIRECALQARAEYEEQRSHDPEAHLRFLPLADLNKRGRPVWLLANLSSLTNIYARINRYCGQALACERLVHDEQLQFDSILADAKTATEALRDRARTFYTPNSDFEFLEAAPLIFASSRYSVGLQLADVLAGFVMRHVRDLTAGRSVDPASVEAFRRLLIGSDAARGVGVNFVLPTRMVVDLHRAHAPE